MRHTTFEGAAKAALFQSQGKIGETPTMGNLFCGAGVFSLAAQDLGIKADYAYEPDDDGRNAYVANFGVEPCVS